MKIRSRVISILVIIEILTLKVIIATSAVYYYQAQLNQFQVRAYEISRLLVVTIGESLMVEQYSSMSEIIDAAFFEINGLDYILVTKENGETLAEKRRGRNLITNHNISVSNTIMIGSNIIAFLDIVYCTDELYKHLFDHIYILILIGLVGLIFSSVWTYRILTNMTNTITKITNNVGSIVNGKLPNEIEISQKDELGQLVNNYNKLVNGLRKTPPTNLS